MKKKPKKKKVQQTFSRREVIKLMRTVCEHQRIICTFPLYFTAKYIGEDGRERLLNVIKNECDIEKAHDKGFKRYL